MVKKIIFCLFISIFWGSFTFVWSADRGSINSGATWIGLDLAAPSYMDTWTFQGSAGEQVSINVEAHSDDLDICITLYDPGGDSVGVTTCGTCGSKSSGRQLEYHLEQTGLYTIIIKDTCPSNSGTYNISFTKDPSDTNTSIYNPFPPIGDTIQNLNGSFSWDPVQGATGYDLYFGKDISERPTKIGDNLVFPSMPFPMTEMQETYKWRVVAHTPDGDMVGPYWWFRVSVVPDVFVNPVSVDFGKINVGISSGPQTLTFTNKGNANFRIRSVELMGPDASMFAVKPGISNPCRYPSSTIPPGSSCTYFVTFKPTSADIRSATLRIVSSNPDIPLIDVALNGEGIVSTLTILTPKCGENIPSDSKYIIKWRAPSQAVNFALEYSTNNGATWKKIASNVTGTSYNWRVPKPRENCTRCFIKVMGYDVSGVKVSEDISEAPFSIEVVRLKSPSGGETWKSNNTYAITWQTNGTAEPVAKVQLFYTTDAGVIWKPITTLTGNPGSYDWKVPEMGALKTRCRVRSIFKDSRGHTVGIDISDNYFTLQR
jgi:hypothetical protein